MVERADIVLSRLGLAKSRTHAASLIKSGLVSVNKAPINKPSQLIDEEAEIIVAEGGCPYVSRGGLKLAGALTAFSIDVTDMTALDIGASTGGFTDCLLKAGAKKVYAVDVGVNQLDSSLKNDPRVLSFEKINARNLPENLFDDRIDIAVMDVSFISQTLIYPSVARILPPGGTLITLIKPQFELGKQALNRHGIVKNIEKAFPSLENKLKSAALANGLVHMGTIRSPIEGGDGNTEYLALFKADK